MDELERKLGFRTCVSLVVGAVIGSSIFMVPATMASQLGSPIGLLLVWTVAGLISLFGGMINAEIGSGMPVTGGQYAYFRFLYGDFFAYLYGWAGFIVINTSSIAGISFVFAHYSGYFISLPHFGPEMEHSLSLSIPFTGTYFILENIGVKMMAILLILASTLVNVRSVNTAGGVQVFFTALKIGALVLLTGLLFFSGQGNRENLVTVATGFDNSALSILTAFMAATTGALAAYDGWNNLGFVAGEIKNPKKNIPAALFTGLTICILLYVLTTEAYLFLLPVDTLKNSTMVASDALGKILGPAAAGMVAAIVMISSAGAAHGNILPCARVTYAMSIQNNFFAFAGKVHHRFHTPASALWLQAVWSIMLVLIGSFWMMMSMFVFITWIFYAFAAAGIFIYRKKMPRQEGTYRMQGYPVLPLVFIGFALLYTGITLHHEISEFLAGKTPAISSLLGLLLTMTGIPFYFLFRKRSSANLQPNEKQK